MPGIRPDFILMSRNAHAALWRISLKEVNTTMRRFMARNFRAVTRNSFQFLVFSF